MCFTIFIIKSEWHLYSCWPDKTSGKIVTTAKSSGRANCDTLHNARHTHARHNCDRDAQLWKPTGLEFTIVQRPAGQREWKWLTVVIIDGQLLLWGGSCYYQWLVAVTLVSSWSRCSASPAPITPFFHQQPPNDTKKWHDLVSNCTKQIFPLFAILVTFFLDGTSAFLDAPMNLQLSCRFYTGSVSMIDFQGKKRGRGNKNGQQKKGAGWRGSEGGTIARNINYTRDASWWTRWPKFSQTHAWAYVQQQETTKYMETKLSWKVGSSL